MTPEQHEELVRQLAELRRQSLIQRRLLMFISACVALPLFFPQVAAYITARSARFLDFAGYYLVPVLALLAGFFVAAVVVSHFLSSKRNEHQRNSA